MKNLNFKEEYNLDKIKKLMQELKNKNLITEKEQKIINPNIILNFTKTKIFNELKNAKEVHKEEPFYINIPANEVMDVKSKEKILVQGIIDLYYITNNNKLVLLDYKTDYVQLGEESILINRHKNQLILYKKALEGALNKIVDNIFIYSTTLGKEIEIKK